MPETPNSDIQKDGSKLFEKVDDDTYRSAFSQLRKMRAVHPTYRDDQLLMRLLCWYISGEGDPTR